MGQIAKCQSLVFSERGQLSQAIPQFYVDRMLDKWSPKGPKIEKIKISLWDWNVQARLKFSSGPPPPPHRDSEGWDWNFQARLKFSSEIENFKRDYILSRFGPLGSPIARFESQHNECEILENQYLSFLGREIWPPRNASNSNRDDNSRWWLYDNLVDISAPKKNI